MRILLTNRRAGILNRRAVTTDGGAPCCCGGPGPGVCHCLGIYRRTHCGLGPDSTCCVVPPNYDTEIEGRHTFTRSAAGGVTAANSSCTAPGIVYKDTITYRLVGKARCVDGVATFDTTGSSFRRVGVVWLSSPPTGTARYFTFADVDATGDSAWMAYQSINPTAYGLNLAAFRAGVMLIPKLLGMFGLSVSDDDPGTSCSGRRSGALFPGFRCPNGIGFTETGNGLFSWTANASSCNGGSFQAGGSSYIRGVPVSAFTTGQIETRDESDEFVTWSRNDNAVQQEPCPDDTCGDAPGFGACCFSTMEPGLGPVDNCRITTAVECRGLGGIYKGDRTDCQTAPCPTLGKCCLPDGTCTHTTEALCQLRLGAYAGDGTVCGPPGTCGPTGACCLPGGCVDGLTEDGCRALGGAYYGDGTRCATATPPCNTPPNQGSCCTPDGRCYDVDAATCAAKSGVFVTNTPCSQRTCLPIVGGPPDGQAILPEPTAGQILELLL